MSRSVQELVQSVLAEGNFDVSEAQVVQWLSSRHETMCARTKCYRRRIALGPTVAEQEAYPLPSEVVEIREVQVQSSVVTGGLGVPYGAGRHIDLAEGALRYLWLGGLYAAVGGGIYVRDESALGQDLLALYPTPSESGLAITVFAVCRPEPLTLVPPSLTAGATGVFRYCSTTRVLTAEEKATFLAGGGLPAGVGTETGVSSVVFEYQEPGAPWQPGTVVKDATGAYHSNVPLVVQGDWLWRAKGLGASGAQVWATPVEEVQVASGLAQLKVPSEFYDALIEGAIATGLTRVESRPDLAAPFETKFADACTELLTEVNKRYRGSGPAQIRLAGINA